MSQPTAEFLLFQVAFRVYAAAVRAVVRVGTIREASAEDLVADTILGRPFARDRGVVVSAERDGRERTLVVDRVLGVRSVPAADVHELPPLAAACLSSAAIAGFVTMDEAPLLIVDLPTLVRERLAAPATAA
ncbi:MAG TPA: chemotaxis protein CheW [Anaeromyxobacter sp.]|nr:chemotaxis protein CheW [Anaeromyxobacter sp.]